MSLDFDCFCADLEPGDDPCIVCKMDTLDKLHILGSNLALAGALCRSFDLGYEHAEATSNFYEGWTDTWDTWAPGYGTDAP